MTDNQDKLVEILFDDSFTGTFKEAMVLAGYSPNTAQFPIQESVSKAILQKSDSYLASRTPEVIKKLFSLVNDPTLPGAKTLLATLSTILDRAGVVKKEKLEVEHSGLNGVLLLPPKNKE